MWGLFYLFLPYALAAILVAGLIEVKAAVIHEFTAEESAVIKAAISDEVTAAIPDEVTGAIPHEVTAPMPEEVTATISDEVTAAIPDEVTGAIPHEVTAPMPEEVTATISDEVTAAISDEVTANVTGEMSTVATEVLADGGTKPNIIDILGQGFQKELQSVKQPIGEAIINIGFAACENVKKFLGISFEQMKEKNVPNLNELALVYKNKLFTTIMNISTAPEALGHLRHFDKQQRLVMFVHGFRGHPSDDSFDNLTRSFFLSTHHSPDHVSVLALDASPMLNWLYLYSTTHVRFIGHKLGQVLAAIVQHQGLDPSHIHIIGYSLGAHISGWAGKTFYALTGKLIDRITGLDPAGPCFEHLDPDMRLKHTDAMYVDVIHTDGGIFGIKDAIGHKDYYPNSGTMQPNCLRTLCSHARSWLLYGESVVNPLALPAVRCKDWDAFKKGECDPEISYMGYPSKPGGSNGMYFLQTGGSYPYGLGLEGVKYQNTDGIVQSFSSLFG